MVLDTFLGLVEFAGFIVSFGATSAVTVGAKAAAEKVTTSLGKEAIEASYKSAIKQLTGAAKETLKAKAWKKVKESITDTALSNITQASCNLIYDTMATTIGVDKGETNDIMTNVVNTAVSAVDVINYTGIKDGCTGSSVVAADCASAIMTGLSTFDPTGLLSIAAAFTKPICDLQVPAVATDADSERLKTVTKACIKVYTDCEFLGDSYEICSDTSYVGEKLNDKVSSIVVGADAYPVFFADQNYVGRFFTMGQATQLNCLTNFTVDNLSVNDMISSVKFNLNNCAIIQWDDGDDGEWDETHILCASNSTFAKNLKKTDVIKFQIMSSDYQLVLYSKNNFTGTSHTISTSVTYDDNDKNPEKSIGFNSINSIKLEKKASKKKRRKY
jgi:hypothetical protein